MSSLTETGGAGEGGGAEGASRGVRLGWRERRRRDAGDPRSGQTDPRQEASPGPGVQREGRARAPHAQDRHQGERGWADVIAQFKHWVGVIWQQEFMQQRASAKKCYSLVYLHVAVSIIIMSYWHKVLKGCSCQTSGVLCHVLVRFWCKTREIICGILTQPSEHFNLKSPT